MPPRSRFATSLGQWGERELIQKIITGLKKMAPARFRVPPGDDAAVMRIPDRTVLSIDGLTEGTHFKLSWERVLRSTARFSLGRGLGWKLMGSSLSDLAAMGGTRDRWALVFVGAPPSCSTSLLMDLARGLREAARRMECVIVGGDTVRSSQLTLVAAVGGTLLGPKPLMRSGARPGDLLCISGNVGDARQGLQFLEGRDSHVPLSNREIFIRRFFDHRPLFKEGLILARTNGVTSLIDLSDSVLESVEILLSRGRLGYEIDVEAIPRSSAFDRLFGASLSLLSHGEDYALLFTATLAAVRQLERKIPLSVLGRVLGPRAGRKVRREGQPVRPPRYFQQFK